MPLNFFGKKKAAPTPKESIAKLRETVEMLEKREQFLQKKCEQQVAQAKQFMTQKNKKAALICLKRKKAYEVQIDKISGAKMTLEQQMMGLESAHVNLGALEAMKMGAESMKQIYKNMTIETVDETMDSIQEQMQLADEVSNAISQPLGGLDIMDDDDLEKELEDLADQTLEEELLSTKTATTALPSVPQKAPATATAAPAKKVAVNEDAELAELEALMN